MMQQRLHSGRSRRPGRPRNLLIVAEGGVAGRISTRLEDTGEVLVIGYVEDVREVERGGRVDRSAEAGAPFSAGRRERCVGMLADFPEICRRMNVDDVLLTLSRYEAAGSLAERERLRVAGRRMVPGRPLEIVRNSYVVIPKRSPAAGRRPATHPLPRPVTAPAMVRPPSPARHPASTWAARAVKRTVDIVGAAVALVVLLPVVAAAALAVRVTSQGPVLFRQTRIGIHGRPFSMLKLRSMLVDSAAGAAAPTAAAPTAAAPAARRGQECAGPFPKLKADPRVTPVGSVVRRLSIDELPQLWNVLRGDMSLVGPRPFVPRDAEQIRGWALDRSAVRPGITGLWQVAGRNDLTFEDMCRLDHLYVHCWSIGLDLRILLRTIPAVVRRHGAY